MGLMGFDETVAKLDTVDHIQDTRCFWDRSTGEEYRPVSLHLLGEPKDRGTRSAKKEGPFTNGKQRQKCFYCLSGQHCA